MQNRNSIGKMRVREWKIISGESLKLIIDQCRMM